MKKGKKESRKLKYIYFIIVLFKGEYLLKFGISNNFRRRFKEYNNSDTIGYFIEPIEVYKTDYPKRLETMLKWYMCQYTKPVFKQEYFDVKYHGLLKNQILKFSEEFGIRLECVLRGEDSYG